MNVLEQLKRLDDMPERYRTMEKASSRPALGR